MPAFEITLKTKLPKRLLERMDAYINNFKRAIALTMVEEFTGAVAIARSTVPIKTGYLQSQIRIEEYDPQNLYIRGGAYTHYAAFVEWGTRKMHARPYWVPAAWEAFFRMMRRVRQIEREL